MPVYYNSVGEGWFKRRDEVIKESEDSEIMKSGNIFLKELQNKVLDKINESAILFIGNKIKEIKRINQLKNENEVKDLYRKVDDMIMMIDGEIKGLEDFEEKAIMIAQKSGLNELMD